MLYPQWAAEGCSVFRGVGPVGMSVIAWALTSNPHCQPGAWTSTVRAVPLGPGLMSIMTRAARHKLWGVTGLRQFQKQPTSWRSQWFSEGFYKFMGRVGTPGQTRNWASASAALHKSELLAVPASMVTCCWLWCGNFTRAAQEPHVGHHSSNPFTFPGDVTQTLWRWEPYGGRKITVPQWLFYCYAGHFLHLI